MLSSTITYTLTHTHVGMHVATYTVLRALKHKGTKER